MYKYIYFYKICFFLGDLYVEFRYFSEIILYISIIYYYIFQIYGYGIIKIVFFILIYKGVLWFDGKFCFYDGEYIFQMFKVEIYSGVIIRFLCFF